MSEQVDYPIVGSFNNQRITNIDAERSVNCFEYIDPRGKKDRCLIFTSGLDIATQNGTSVPINFANATGGARAEFILGGNHFIVFGNNLYLINNFNVAILLLPNNIVQATSFTTNVGYIGIDANQATDPQVIFVDGQFGYIYDTVAQTFSRILDSSFPTNAYRCVL